MSKNSVAQCGGISRRRSKAIQPYLQGQLDGLCGVYSIVNAIRVLCPELRNDVFEYLFDHLIRVLPKAGVDVSVTVTGGIGQRVFTALLKEALAEMAAEYDINLASRRLPKKFRRATKLGGLFRKLEGTLSPTCVAVLGMDGRHNHWTVAVTATLQSIKLFDSSKMSVLRRSGCKVGLAVNRTGISMSHVFLVERLDIT